MKHTPGSSSALQALAAAALALPGVSWVGQAHAGEEQFSIQGSHVREQGRSASGEWSQTPLKVDTLQAQGRFALGEDADLTIRAAQDTWSGATPISTAPLSARGNRPVQAGQLGQLVTVGASPMVTGRVLVDRQFRPLAVDATGRPTGRLDNPAHTYSSASPETRRQVDFDWRLRQPGTTLQLGLGRSQERDYESTTMRAGRSWNANNDLTTIATNLQFTHNRVDATLDHDAAPYVNSAAWRDHINARDGASVLNGKRNDGGVSLGITQVLDAASLLQADVGLLRQRGYLSNPYKGVSTLFIEPGTQDAQGMAQANLQTLMEKRPAGRTQWQFGLKWIRHIESTDAALRLAWKHSRDNWAIRSHAIEGEWAQPLSGGWMVTPRARYYTQTAARFYAPWLVSQQAYRSVSFGTDGQPVVTPFNPAMLPSSYSSDSRLAGFGNLSLGIGVARQMGGGVRWHAGLDWTRQSGSLKAGGGGIGSFADLRWLTAYAGLTVRLDDPLNARGAPLSVQGKEKEDHTADDHSHEAHGHGDMVAPPGVNFGHWLAPGEWRLGHRMQVMRQGPALVRDGSTVNDATLESLGCGSTPCLLRPQSMRMTMQMLELTIGASDWINIMVMPQYVDMSMRSRRIGNSLAALDQPQVHEGRHETGGLGDTSVYAVALGHSDSQSRSTWALGLSVPTGASGLRMRRTHQVEPSPVHYDMQLGSGTWDLLAATTWAWTQGAWGWGAQASTVQRLQSANAQGYALGNAVQANAWLTRRLGPSWTLTGRVQHTVQRAIRGAYAGAPAATSPADMPAHHGGRFTELGLGAVYMVKSGPWRGSEFNAEWMIPLRSTYNGVQLERRSGMALGWAFHF